MSLNTKKEIEEEEWVSTWDDADKQKSDGKE